MSGPEVVTVAPQDADIRLDKWFHRHRPDMPYGLLAKLLRKGAIRVNGKKAKPGLRVQTGDEIRLPAVEKGKDKPQKKQQQSLTGEDKKFIRSLVIVEGPDWFILNKPAGLAVQGGSGTHHHIDGLLPGLKAGPGDDPKLVHRLDKDTSGVLVIARHAKAAAMLTRAFRARDGKKIYWALVAGVPEVADGTIKAALEKRPGRGGEKMEVTQDGKWAMTHYSVLDRAGMEVAWVALRPVTGRTHQLRVHMAEAGHPVIGDGKYGGADARPVGGLQNRLHLHARAIRLPLADGRVLEAHAPLPDHMEDSFATLGFDARAVEDPFEGLDE